MSRRLIFLLRVVVPLVLVPWLWKKNRSPLLFESSLESITTKTNAWSTASWEAFLNDEGVSPNEDDEESFHYNDTAAADEDHNDVNIISVAASAVEPEKDELCYPWNKEIEPPRSLCCSDDYCEMLRTMTAYSRCCSTAVVGDQQGVKKIRSILITGTPRSGTVFVSSLLSALGLRLSNDAERPAPAGMVSWLHLYNDHFPDLRWTKRFDKATFFRHVVQQVRDPLASITSMAFTEPVGDAGYIGFIARHVPITDLAVTFPSLREDANSGQYDILRIRRTLEFYIGWHEAIVKLGVPRFRLEDFVQPNNTIVPKLFDWAGLPQPDPAVVQAKMDQIRRRWRRRRQLQKRKMAVDHNHRQHRPTLEWHELCEVDVGLTKRFFALSQTFGYYGNMTSVCS